MSTTKLGDDLMRVLKLDVSGNNWVVYKTRFLWEIDARGLLEHVDGSEWEPTKPTLKGKQAGDSSEGGETSGGELGKLMVKEERRLEVWKKELRAWKHGEAVVKQQVVVTIPDSLFMQI